jgi:hypothetical protein
MTDDQNMKTTLSIEGKSFFCGVVLHDDRVVIAAPIVKKWALGRTRQEVETYARQHGYRVREL